ncbi:hypothetical protein [Krasilnikovia sp. M28-CT-15]
MPATGRQQRAASAHSHLRDNPAAMAETLLADSLLIGDDNDAAAVLVRVD